MSEVEEWRPVVGWEGLYEVSSLGRVRSLDRMVVRRLSHGRTSCAWLRGIVLKALLGNHGYLYVRLSKANLATAKCVHQIVCRAFHGQCPQGCQTAHNNGVKIDNRAANLRWATRIENSADCIEHGTRPTGCKHPLHKLTEDDVRAIWKLRGKLSYAEIGRSYGTGPQNVYKILSRQRWKHITEGLP